MKNKHEDVIKLNYVITKIVIQKMNYVVFIKMKKTFIADKRSFSL